MSSSERWIKVSSVNSTTTMNSKVVMNAIQVNNMTLWLFQPPISSLVLGDYTKWCSSLIYYPFNIPSDSTVEKQLVVGGQTKNGVNCNGGLALNTVFGFNMGQRFYETASSYKDYEPYTKVQVWLPYYGFADLKVADISGKWVQFRLYIDFNTGSGQYVIGVSPTQVSIPNDPYLLGVDDTNTLIIGTYTVQLGYSIPLGTVGMSDTLRNISLATIRGAGQLGASMLAEGLGATKVTSSRQYTQTRRNPQTNRQILYKKETSQSTTDYSGYQLERRLSSGAETATAVLNAFQLSPTLDKTTNSIINSATCQSIVFVIRQITPTVDDDSLPEYNKFYGSPACYTSLIEDVSGYTEIGRIHFEGAGFEQATAKEISMLEELCNDGIIL